MTRPHLTRQDDIFAMLTKHAAERICHFSQGGITFDRFDEARHQVVAPPGGRCQACQSVLHTGGITLRPQGTQPFNLLAFQGRINTHNGGGWLILQDILVYPHNNTGFRLDFLLIAVCTLLNLALWEARLDRLDGTTEIINLLDVGRGLLFNGIRQRFNSIGSSNRVNGFGDASLIGDDLLRAQGNLYGLFGR